MARFVYIGTLTKADGTVDVRARDSQGVTREWTGVIPEKTEIDIGEDAKLLKFFEYGSDCFGQLIYLRVD